MKVPGLWFAWGVAVVAGLAAGTAQAGDKPLALQPLADEVQASGPVDASMLKVLKYAGRCLQYDARRQWDQTTQQSNRAIYDGLAVPLACWQRAEKKAKKLGPSFAPAASWISAQARLVEFYRDYVWFLDAKLHSDALRLCTRMETAMRRGRAAQVASEDLAVEYRVPAAAELARQVEVRVEDLLTAFSMEVQAQRCS